MGPNKNALDRSKKANQKEVNIEEYL